MIWSLQILRFIAALMVVYVHAAQAARSVTGSIGIIPLNLAVMGQAGVDIFFVLSGVVIAKTAPGMTSEQFLWRRIRRILPIYYVAGLLSALFISAHTGIGWRDVLATFLLWPATDVMTTSLLPVGWTLSFEMLFYLSAALVLRDRRWLYVLGGFYVVAFALRPLSPVFQFLGNPLIFEFVFGVVLAHAPPLPRLVGAWLVLLGFTALAAAGPLGISPQGAMPQFMTGEDNVQRALVYGLPSAMIVYGTMQIKARESVWTYLGDASYSLYLFHTFAILPLVVLAYPIHADFIVIIGMAASVLLAWRIHVLIEMPILRAIPTSMTR